MKDRFRVELILYRRARVIEGGYKLEKSKKTVVYGKDCKFKTCKDVISVLVKEAKPSLDSCTKAEIIVWNNKIGSRMMLKESDEKFDYHWDGEGFNQKKAA